MMTCCTSPWTHCEHEHHRCGRGGWSRGRGGGSSIQADACSSDPVREIGMYRCWTLIDMACLLSFCRAAEMV